MTTITTRAGKGEPLTHPEVDANFTNLNTDKYEAGDSPSFASATITGNLTVDTNTLYVDSVNDRVGIGTSNPGALFTVDGGLIEYPSGPSGTALFQVLGGTSKYAAYIGVTDTGVTFGHNGSSPRALIFDINETERMRIDSSGRVGIGTSSPASPLTVKSNSSAVGMGILCRSSNDFGFLQFKSTDDAETIAEVSVNRTAANTGSLRFSTSNGGSPSERMRIDSSGRVGIGTSSPAAPLHISSAGEVAPRVESSNGAGDAVLRFYSGTTYKGQIGWDQLDDVVGIYPKTSSSVPTLAVDGSNVGIGTSSPSRKLQVNGDIQATDYRAAAGSVFFATGDELRVRTTSGSERMRIDSSGRVGIGTSSPLGYLHIAGSDPFNLPVRIENTGGSNSFDIRVGTGATLLETNGAQAIGFSTNNTERMRIDSSGNLLVGKTAGDFGGTAGVEIRDSGIAIGKDGTNHLVINNIASTGVIQVFRQAGNGVGSISVTASSTAYNTTSDYRLKEDIQPVPNASDRVLALKPVNFAWKADGSRVDGFLAHEAQEVVPEAVTGEKDAVDADGNPEYQGIDQSKLVPVLTAALQEALQRIEALEAQLNP